MKSFGIALLFASVALAGCKPASNEPPPVVAPKVETAEDVANGLVKAGLPVANIKVVTAETDDNKMLGRPGQYNSKVYFDDTRHPTKEDEFETVENTIEGFPSEEEAKRRQEYVAEVTKAMPMFNQYIYRAGKFVLRLDKAVLPDEAKAYETALSKITG